MKTIIKKPIITEKATGLSEAFNRFTFAVDRTANKIEIKKAVEKMYGVQITDVRTMNYGGGKPSTKYFICKMLYDLPDRGECGTIRSKLPLATEQRNRKRAPAQRAPNYAERSN